MTVLMVVAAGIVVAASAVYVFLHRRLTERVREILGRAADSR
ncbi:MAG: hypothetical protein ACYCXZ_08120 [Coriobacteriia bacterium]